MSAVAVAALGKMVGHSLKGKLVVLESLMRSFHARNYLSWTASIVASPRRSISLSALSGSRSPDEDRKRVKHSRYVPHNGLRPSPAFQPSLPFWPEQTLFPPQDPGHRQAAAQEQKAHRFGNGNVVTGSVDADTCNPSIQE